MPPSKKRKLGDDATKYYAVRTGKKPGVYMSWGDCQEQTTGFKGASCMYFPCSRICCIPFTDYVFAIIVKSFPSKQDAEDFVSGKVTSGPQKWYGVAVGHVPGVYNNWDEARIQVQHGAKLPKYMGFATKAEAQAFVDSGGKVPEVAKKVKAVKETEEPSAKKVKTGTDSKKKPVKVWTDGSALGNGKVGSAAGVGVYFGENDERYAPPPSVHRSMLTFTAISPSLSPAIPKPTTAPNSPASFARWRSPPTTGTWRS